MKSPRLMVLVLLLLLLSGPLRIEAQDDEYISVYSLVEEADALSKSGKVEQGRAKYKEAQAALLQFQKNNPKWNSGMISYRLKYVAEKLAPEKKPSADSTVPDSGANAAKSVSKSSSKIPGSSNGGVKLIEAGGEPKKAFRIQPAIGEKQSVEVTLESEIGMQMPGVSGGNTRMPVMKLTVGATPRSIVESGDVNYEVEIEGFDIASGSDAPPQVVESFKAGFAGVKGLKLNCTMSDLGLVKKSDVKLPPGADPKLAQAFESVKEGLLKIECLLPSEPIGPGAKWEVKQSIKSQGITVDQTTSYELVSVEGNLLKILSSCVQQAGNQKIANPAVPQAKVDLAKLSGDGTSSLTIDLMKVMPSQLVATNRAEMTMNMAAGNQKSTMVMKTDLVVRMQNVHTEARK